MKTQVAFVGCGFVADFYFETIQLYPSLKIKGVFDKNESRKSRFSNFYKLYPYRSLEEIANDEEIKIVINLTDPANHYQITKFFLERGKHVYSEKPLADEFQKCKELIQLAKSNDLHLAGAPCTIFSNTVQTIKKALDENLIGKPRLVYANIDEGPIDLMECEKWISRSGTTWPVQQELEVGCTIEHAGYYVSWLLYLFGKPKRVIGFSKCLKPQKKTYKISTPDFSVGIIYFESGVVAKLTNSIYAPHNHQFQIIGDYGTLSTDNCFHAHAPVLYQNFNFLNLKTQGHPLKKIPGVQSTLNQIGAGEKKLKMVFPSPLKFKLKKHFIDFGAGVYELSKAILNGKRAKNSEEFLEILSEVIFSISEASESGKIVEIQKGEFIEKL